MHAAMSEIPPDHARLDVPRRPPDWTRRALLLAAVVLLALLLGFAVEVLLLGFAGALLAVLLRAVSDPLSRRTGLSPRWALVVTLGLILLLFGGAGWLIAPDLAEQTQELSEQLPQALQDVRGQLAQYSWGAKLIEEADQAGKLASGSADSWLSRLAGFFTVTAAALVNAVVVLFVGLYLAFQPSLYVRGFLGLIPPPRRRRAAEVLDAVGHTLRWWLIGKAFSMLVIGVLTTLGLWLLGIPLALSLGLIAGLLSFIPNVGPILSVIPAALLGLMQSPQVALYVLLLYVGIQVVESNLLTPLVEQRTVYLPPALTLLAEVLFAVLIGGLGLLLAAPLTATALVLVKMLYIEDTLGETANVR